MASGDRLKRLLHLVGLLQSGRTHHAHELAALCDVSPRTIFRDLNVLERAGVPVVNRADRGYEILGDTALPPTELTLEETLSLLLLAHAFGDSEHGVPFLKTARKASVKLLGTLPARVRDYVGEMTQALDVRLEAPADTPGADRWYDQFARSLHERRKVRLRYHSLTSGEPSELSTVLSPYRLLFARRAWYVVGRSSVHRAVRTFHLGRVRDVVPLEDRYDIPARFSLERFLGNAWFLINERGKRYDVRVRFQPLFAENVAEVRWHATQRTAWNDDGTLDFQVTVSSLREIVWWILGYGDQAEALEPPELRDEIRKRLDAAQARYSASPRAAPPQPRN